MSDDFVQWCRELLGAAGPVRSRRMFGGHGFYVDGLFIALIAAERLYLKVDADNRAAFEAAGCTPFEYSRSDSQAVTLAYFSAPEDAMDSPAQMLPWARLAMASALRAQARKRPAAPRAKPAAARSKGRRQAGTG